MTHFNPADHGALISPDRIRAGDQVAVLQDDTVTVVTAHAPAYAENATGFYLERPGRAAVWINTARGDQVYLLDRPLPTAPGTLIARAVTTANGGGTGTAWLYAATGTAWQSLDAPSSHQISLDEMERCNARGTVTVLFTPSPTPPADKDVSA